MRQVNKIILHTSDSPDSMDIGYKEINQWHKEKGWLSKSGVSCGYHYIIRRDGTIEKGRPDAEVGAHCFGQNKMSIGVVWVGRNQPSMKQNNSMIGLLRYLVDKYKLNPSEVYGHCEFTDNKTCPNLNMNTIRWEVLSCFTPINPEVIVENS